MCGFYILGNTYWQLRYIFFNHILPIICFMYLQYFTKNFINFIPNPNWMVIYLVTPILPSSSEVQKLQYFYQRNANYLMFTDPRKLRLILFPFFNVTVNYHSSFNYKCNYRQYISLLVWRRKNLRVSRKCWAGIAKMKIEVNSTAIVF